MFWRLLFADSHAANVSERMCEAIKIKIIVNVKFILTFTIITPLSLCQHLGSIPLVVNSGHVNNELRTLLPYSVNAISPIILLKELSYKLYLSNVPLNP